LTDNGFPVCGFMTTRRICSCGTPSPTMILTALRCSAVGTNFFSQSDLLHQTSYPPFIGP
jgi:hypothetical protein